MVRRALVVAAIVVVLFVLVSSCGPDETPEQRVARLRYRHEITPVGITTFHDADQKPALMIELQVANQGVDPLPHLTVLVRAVAADGTEKMAQRVTLDLSAVRPGTGERLSAVLPGIALADDDQVFLEVEHGLSPEEIRLLPEYHDVVASVS